MSSPTAPTARPRGRSRTLASPRIALRAGAAALLLAACGPATGGDPEFWEPVPDDGLGGAGGQGLGGSAGSGGGATVTTTTSAGGDTTSSTSTGSTSTPMDPALTVDFTTKPFGGQYSPRNVGAVWIEDGSGAFVKTLELWAKKRSKYLVKWKAASAGNTVDAVTGATRSSHGPHTDHWNGTDVNGNVVPDGPYHLYVEFTEQNGAGKWTVMDFEKGATPVDLTPPDEANFVAKHLTFSE